MKSANAHAEPPLTSLPKIVSREEWRRARDELLIKEKAATKARDALNAERRRLPMVRIEKDYTFAGPDGKVRLLDLFDGRRQLIVYHFMFAPGVHGWPMAGCPGCSMVVDHIGPLEHLHARDTSLVLVSLGPLANLEAYKDRMGWKVPWYSSAGTSFNADFGLSTDEGEPSGTNRAERDGSPEATRRVAPEGAGKHTAEGSPQGASGGEHETFGLSVFLRDGEAVYHTYFTTDRGIEVVDTNFTLLDWTPLGRQETWEDSPPGWPQSEPYVWWRRHDEY